MLEAAAMVIKEYGQPLIPMEIPIPSLEAGEVLVRICAAGICGSDVHIWQGGDSRTKLPMILGHEGIGIVQDLANQRIDLTGNEIQVGDLIAWDRGVTCGRCYYCVVKRKPYLCEKRWTYGISKGVNEPPFLNGCYSTHLILTKETHLIRILPQDEVQGEDIVPFVIAAGCPGTMSACMLDQARISPGDNVVIQGPGPIGIFTAAMARLQGASAVIVIGGSAERLAMCQEVGATLTIDRTKTTPARRLELVMETTGGRGADVVLESAGTIEAIEEGLGFAGKGAVYITAGIAVPAKKAEVDWFELTKKNIAIQGVWVGDARHTYQALKIMKQNKEKLSGIISHRLKLSETNTALGIMKNKEGLKVVLIPD